MKQFVSNIYSDVVEFVQSLAIGNYEFVASVVIPIATSL